MICEPKGALDRSLIMRFTTANFLDQRQAHVRPCEEPNGGDQPIDHQEREEHDESDHVDEVSLLFWRHSEMVEYFYGGFSVMDAMIRDMAACFHVDMSRQTFHLVQIGLFSLGNSTCRRQPMMMMVLMRMLMIRLWCSCS